MVYVVLGAAIGAGVLVSLAALRQRRRRLLARHGRSHTRVAPVVPPGPLSRVHILQDEGELREAARAAAAFEQRVALTAQARSRRYEQLIAPSNVADIRTGIRTAHHRGGGSPPATSGSA